jgi:hypothetical protein
MLADTSVVKFYPSKFVLITDVLDKFGGFDNHQSASDTAGALVYSRLLSKATYTVPGTNTTVPLPENFTADQVFLRVIWCCDCPG